MEQNEFRIGNWVLDKGIPVQIAGLQATGRIVVDDRTYDDGKRGIEPEPISLTPDIIVKTGFEKRIFDTAKPEYYGYYKDPFFIYRPGGPGNDYGLGVKGFGVLLSVNSLHQLQNIYFALTHEELQYNPQ